MSCAQITADRQCGAEGMQVIKQAGPSSHEGFVDWGRGSGFYSKYDGRQLDGSEEAYSTIWVQKGKPLVYGEMDYGG